MVDHLRDYLTYYETLTAPGYAVLITGEWGTGKTHQIRQFYAGRRMFYVSLFGVNSVEDVHAAIFAAMAPTQQKIRSTLKAAGQAGKDVGGAWALTGIASNIAVNLMKAKIDNKITIVFDDLERSGLRQLSLLGTINEYVEHYNCRVLIVAHDEKLAKNFSTMKEKLIGHTIKVTPNSNDAFQSFISSENFDDRDFFTYHKETVIDIFDKSEVKSLRILKHLLEDIKRLKSAIHQRHLDNKKAITELISIFSALSLEVRAGRLGREDLYNRRLSLNSYLLETMDGKTTEMSPFVTAENRYGDIKIDSSLLPDDLLKNMLIDGLYDDQEIQSALDSSLHFANASELPSWKVLIQFDVAEDEEIDIAMASFNDEFRSRAITEPGIMMHVFALRLMFAEEGIIESDLNTTAEECHSYITDLITTGRMPPRPLEWRWKLDLGRGGYDGFGYWITEKTGPILADLAGAIDDGREAILVSKYPEISSELLAALATDGQRFQDLICGSTSTEANYKCIPVLASIDTGLFVDTLLSSPKSNWYSIFGSLKERKQSISRGIGLEEEVNWFAKLNQELQARAAAMSGLAAFRLRRMSV